MATIYLLNNILSTVSYTASNGSAIMNCELGMIQKHNRSEMVAVLGPYEALPYYIHTYIGMI
jgi:hypothetical protein